MDQQKQVTLGEMMLWDALRDKKFRGLQFNKHTVIPLPRTTEREECYIADICCEEAGLIIKLDQNMRESLANHDFRREMLLNGMGFKVLHINKEFLAKSLGPVLFQIGIIIDAE